MISFSILYIFLSLFIVVGVIFVVHGLSQKPPRRRLEFDYQQDPTSPETQLSNDVIFDLQLEEGGKVYRYEDPDIPERFDPDFIQTQLSKVQCSPNIITAYFNNLEARFRNHQDMKLLKQMKSYNELLASAVASKATIYEAQMALDQAIRKWKREQSPRIQKLLDDEAESEIIARTITHKVTIAEGEAKIKEFKAPPQQQQNSRPSPEEYRQKRIREFDVKADDMAALDEWRRNQLDKLDRRMKEELEDLKDGPWSGQEKERKIDEIHSRYGRQREEILTMKPRRG